MKKRNSIFSYTGTKYKLIEFLKENIKFDSNNQTWCEPFCGSCVVGLNFAPKNVLFNDINCHLIEFYNFLWWCFYEEGINFREYFEKNYIDKLKEKHGEFYYQIRKEFNEKWREIGSVEKLHELKIQAEKYPEDWRIKFVLDFFFLSQSGFSHNLRYNKKCEINQAYSKFEYLLNEKTKEGTYERVEDFAKFLTKEVYGFSFFSFDWENFLEVIDELIKYKKVSPENYFVYCDPPYVGYTQDYFGEKFTEEDLKQMLNKLENMGVDFAISGSCTDNEKEKIENFYKGHRVVYTERQCAVFSKSVRNFIEYLVLK